ncbi:MAG TPA: acyloxyacyl hydrolase [Candidatus Binatia bacterium]|nr:acyloxyacyl hydrolase [Candidatus Binatia bacterium]
MKAKSVRGNGGVLLAAILATLLAEGPARAESVTQGDAHAACFLLSPQEVSFRFAYGYGDRASLNFFTFGPRAAYDLPGFVPAILGNRIRWVIEATGSIITHGPDHDLDGEFALSPLIFNYRYDTGGFFVPYVEGGEGIVLTTLNHLNIGGPFEFSSQGGGGFDLFFSRENALSFDVRYRHISNLGISNDNSGLGTVFFTIGLSHFPGR